MMEKIPGEYEIQKEKELKFLIKFKLLRDPIANGYSPTWTYTNKKEHNGARIVNIKGDIATLEPLFPNLWTEVDIGDNIYAYEGSRQTVHAIVVEVISELPKMNICKNCKYVKTPSSANCYSYWCSHNPRTDPVSGIKLFYLCEKKNFYGDCPYYDYKYKEPISGFWKRFWKLLYPDGD